MERERERDIYIYIYNGRWRRRASTSAWSQAPKPPGASAVGSSQRPPLLKWGVSDQAGGEPCFFFLFGGVPLHENSLGHPAKAKNLSIIQLRASLQARAPRGCPMADSAIRAYPWPAALSEQLLWRFSVWRQAVSRCASPQARAPRTARAADGPIGHPALEPPLSYRL